MACSRRRIKKANEWILWTAWNRKRNCAEKLISCTTHSRLAGFVRDFCDRFFVTLLHHFAENDHFYSFVSILTAHNIICSPALHFGLNFKRLYFGLTNFTERNKAHTHSDNAMPIKQFQLNMWACVCACVCRCAVKSKRFFNVSMHIYLNTHVCIMYMRMDIRTHSLWVLPNFPERISYYNFMVIIARSICFV